MAKQKKNNTKRKSKRLKLKTKIPKLENTNIEQNEPLQKSTRTKDSLASAKIPSEDAAHMFSHQTDLHLALQQFVLESVFARDRI